MVGEQKAVRENRHGRPAPTASQFRLRSSDLTPESQLIGFHLKGHRTPQGLAANDMLQFGDIEIEESHAWVQWVFPSPEPSQFNKTAPTLTWQEAVTLASDAKFIERLESSTARYLVILGPQRSLAART